MRFSINVEADDRGTISVLKILRDLLNEGRTLFYITGNDCKDGCEVLTIGVYAKEDTA